MKVKAGLKEFISENMIFRNYGGLVRLEIKDDAFSRLSSRELRYAIKLRERHYKKKGIFDSELDVCGIFPLLLPGKLIELRNGERFIIIHDLLNQNLSKGGYIMVGLHESLDSLMYSENLVPNPSYSQVLGDRKEDYIIDKVYTIFSLSPGLESLLSDSELKYSMKLIWQRQ